MNPIDESFDIDLANLKIPIVKYAPCNAYGPHNCKLHDSPAQNNPVFESKALAKLINVLESISATCIENYPNSHKMPILISKDVFDILAICGCENFYYATQKCKLLKFSLRQLANSHCIQSEKLINEYWGINNSGIYKIPIQNIEKYRAVFDFIFVGKVPGKTLIIYCTGHFYEPVCEFLNKEILCRLDAHKISFTVGIQFMSGEKSITLYFSKNNGICDILISDF